MDARPRNVHLLLEREVNADQDTLALGSGSSGSFRSRSPHGSGRAPRREEPEEKSSRPKRRASDLWKTWPEEKSRREEPKRRASDLLKSDEITEQLLLAAHPFEILKSGVSRMTGHPFVQ